MTSDTAHNFEAQLLAGDLLRQAGLRSTPQRRTILASFHGGAAEHLSADEVYARAAASLPDLGRGTVYATLAEFTEVGLLAAFGTPEPVRYETNTDGHAHFRCRVCLRIFDVHGPTALPAAFAQAGHTVEVLDLRAEGVCRQCRDYGEGLAEGVEAIFAHGASDWMVGREADVAVAELQTPVGPLLVAATAAGVARVAFPEHGDAERLSALVGAQAPPEARAQLDRALEQLGEYFAASRQALDCPIDWEVVGGREDLRAAQEIPYGTTRPYHELGTEDETRGIARAYGANPVPIITPCHRASQGAVMPHVFVGTPERRIWLLEHERDVLGR